MRVLTVANDLEPYGGLERMQLEIHQHLRARGHVTVLAHTREGSLTAAWEACADRRTRLATTRVQPRRPGQALRALRGLDALARATRPDVVHLHHYRHLHLAVPVARRRRTPVLLHLHSAPPDGLGPVGRRLLDSADRVVAVSEHTAAGWRRWRTDVGVVRNGVDLEAWAPADDRARQRAREVLALPPQAFVVGFAGRITGHKGVPELLAAWRHLAWSPDEARLLVAGPDEIGLLARGDLPAGVDAQGFLPDPRDLYAASDVLAVPSTWPDPCPRSVLEGMASGRAVLASRVGGIPELLAPGGGVLVPPGDHHALATALRELRDDPTRVRALGDAGRRRAERELDLRGCIDEVERLLAAGGEVPAA